MVSGNALDKIESSERFTRAPCGLPGHSLEIVFTSETGHMKNRVTSEERNARIANCRHSWTAAANVQRRPETLAPPLKFKVLCQRDNEM